MVFYYGVKLRILVGSFQCAVGSIQLAVFSWQLAEKITANWQLNTADCKLATD
jgi:hypothetical protein